jgi:hypothetical protein
MASVASATDGAAPNRPAKLLGRRTSLSTAKADTMTPPTRKRTRYSGHFAFFRVSPGAHRFRRPDLSAAAAPSDGLERARTVFDSRALVVRTGRRVGANDEEVVVRGQALVPRAGRQDGRVAGLQREDPALLPPKRTRPLPRAYRAPHGSGVIMNVVVDAVARYRPIRLLQRSSITAAGSWPSSRSTAPR